MRNIRKNTEYVTRAVTERYVDHGTGCSVLLVKPRNSGANPVCGFSYLQVGFSSSKGHGLLNPCPCFTSLVSL